MARYWYTLEHLDDQGRMYAARLDFDQPSEARKAHRLSCDFMWVKEGMKSPSVSTLYATDERTSVEIRPSCRPGDDPDREYVDVPPPQHIREQLGLGILEPEGRDMASRHDKAEEQRADLGSSPSTSTSHLPF